jgi:urease beta subunit
MHPGEWLLGDGEIELNAGRRRLTLRVDNLGDRPIQVGSHTHFFEVNRFLKFDRARGYGHRLNIPAGTALRFEPGEGREVELVELAGARRAYGMNALVNGSLDEDRDRALDRARTAGFLKPPR